jgi:1,2-diacylglycerol 3-beta-glucosyltransferase
MQAVAPSFQRPGGGLALNDGSISIDVGGGGAIQPGPSLPSIPTPSLPSLGLRTPLGLRMPRRPGSLPLIGTPHSRRRRAWFRQRPFHDTWRCWAIGLLSIVSICLLVAYLTTPAPQIGCTAHCASSASLTLAYSVLTAATWAITLYFFGLYAIGLARSRRLVPDADSQADSPLYVLVTPAHNEAVVIAETVRCMLRLRGRFLVVVVNDGSTDGTGDIARDAGQGDERLIVIDRPPEIAGQGKGEVLNTAYREICEMVDSNDPRLGGASEEQVVMCVLDADGWLRADALEKVAPYFEEESVAGVQVPVRMYNARRGFLACMQDIEFIGFSVLIQGGRDTLGSTLLGGNGQFVRLSALRTLGPAPWTKALTEDLDLGLRLVRAGWTNRVCVETCVAQQAVTRPRALLRQRTRWVQGHYSCWSHLPALWRTRGIRMRTRVDLSLHLLLASTILIVTTQALMGLGGFLGLLPLGQIPVAKLVGADVLYRLCVLVAICGPLGMLGIAYQKAAVDYQASARRRLPWWSVPGVFLSFTFYVYFWGLPSTFRAFGRLALGRGSWAKTAREPLSPAELKPAPEV